MNAIETLKAQTAYYQDGLISSKEYLAKVLSTVGECWETGKDLKETSNWISQCFSTTGEGNA